MSSRRLMNSGLNVRLAPPGRRDVRGHDQHDVLEVDRAALAVGQAPVVHHLQQHVEDVGWAFSISSSSTPSTGAGARPR
jgi:hypothetical protein